MKKRIIILDKGLSPKEIVKNMSCCSGPSAKK
jgi:hypothetical protein